MQFILLHLPKWTPIYEKQLFPIIMLQGSVILWQLYNRDFLKNLIDHLHVFVEDSVIWGNILFK